MSLSDIGRVLYPWSARPEQGSFEKPQIGAKDIRKISVEKKMSSNIYLCKLFFKDAVKISCILANNKIVDLFNNIAFRGSIKIDPKEKWFIQPYCANHNGPLPVSSDTDVSWVAKLYANRMLEIQKIEEGVEGILTKKSSPSKLLAPLPKTENDFKLKETSDSDLSIKLPCELE